MCRAMTFFGFEAWLSVVYKLQHTDKKSFHSRLQRYSDPWFVWKRSPKSKRSTLRHMKCRNIFDRLTSSDVCGYFSLEVNCLSDKACVQTQNTIFYSNMCGNAHVQFRTRHFNWLATNEFIELHVSFFIQYIYKYL